MAAAGADALFDSAPAPAVAPPLALYRRYRPDTFADVIGQEHVTEPLQRALVNNRVNHAYLFSGPRGCGKTTSARILARALNCEKAPVAEPCGECRSCRDLATGGPGSIDVIEIDAASHGGVDDARDLRERAFFAPVSSRYKIYIVDEAHMVTTAGFNALLKLVEEPPPHVKFIFATTEPDKVIGTIRSRTHHYPFRLVPPRVLTDYLAKLCSAEGIEVENGVLPLVVRAGAGSVRDSLSVLDQLLGGASERGVSYAQGAALLGYTPDSLLDEMLDAFAAGDSGGVFRCVDKVIEVGQDPRRFAEDLLRRIRDLVIVAAVPDALTSGLVDVADDQAERLSSQAAALGAGELTRAGEVIAAGLTEMRGTTAPRLHLELMCARVLLPGTDLDDRGVHARLDRLERRIGMTGAAAPTAAPAQPQTAQPATGSGEPAEQPAGHTPEPAAPQSATGQQPASAPSREPAAEDWPTPATPGNVASQTPPEPARSDDAVSPSGQEPQAAPQQPPPGQAPPQQASPPAAQGFTITDLRRLWPDVLEEVKDRRRFTWILLSQNAHLADLTNGTLVLAMPNAGARDSFGRGGSEDVLREALITVIGADLKIETMVDPSAGGSAGRGNRPSGPATPDRGGASASGPSGSSGSASIGTAPSGSPASGTTPSGVSAGWTGDVPAGTQAPPTAAPDQSAGRSIPPDPAGSGPAAGPTARPRTGDPADPPPWAVDDPQPRGAAVPPGRMGEPQTDEWEVRDAAAHRDDDVLDDAGISHTELLQQRLGAEIIAEEESGA
ncbi:DNA polymerase III subunit gamma and tau [Microlunatus sp. Gsoil 973]|uniref:DNA polymerase III subunit gamma and tau n=1 Tax=Microlunatus sp. Gsoil 973 TaxID=2672569 RepID=UPI0012B4762A|nr:DNA polymerase III subunit gamma and tau [Microlunatus sp. Gsoil 973]QGN35642.1 DNA polymerase III subunit gamma and tau [Microlunatus sp. Gsoil 973]